MNRQELALEFARAKLLPFCVGIYPDYEIANHHKLIAKKLEQIESREIKKLMVFMPPRHGKSLLISQLFPAWYLGRNPNHRIIFTSYSQDIAFDFGRKVRNSLGDDKYKKIFPYTSVSKDSASASRFNTNQDGEYFAVGAGGALTGRGGDVIIIDDIHKNREEAHSDTVRNKLHDWFGSTLYTRKMPNAAIVLVMTRWHTDDIAGRLLKEHDDWEVLSLPAIDDKGVALWPERYALDSLADIKKTIGSADFEALYQQRPVAAEGNIIKKQWLKFYDKMPERNRFTEVIQSWDLTFSGKQTSDYAVGQVWGRIGAEKYLLDQVRGQFGLTDTIASIRYLSSKWPQASLKIIENKANGPAVEDVMKKSLSGIVLWEPTGDKLARANAVSPQFEAGNIFLPTQNEWIDDYITELTSFPNGAHDDCVDATTMALLRLESNLTGAGGLRILRR